MMRMKDLLQTRFAQKVKVAIESGDLAASNYREWAKEYNGGFASKSLEEEVWALYLHFAH